MDLQRRLAAPRRAAEDLAVGHVVGAGRALELDRGVGVDVDRAHRADALVVVAVLLLQQQLERGGDGGLAGLVGAHDDRHAVLELEHTVVDTSDVLEVDAVDPHGGSPVRGATCQQDGGGV